MLGGMVRDWPKQSVYPLRLMVIEVDTRTRRAVELAKTCQAHPARNREQRPLHVMIMPRVWPCRFSENASVLRNVLAGLVCLLLAARSAGAQDWASKMFDTMSHDFGTVAKGSKTEYRFQLKNVFEEDAHILSVQSSCGCTTPVITKSLLKTFETGEIVAEFNTRDFTGHRSATLTVKLDKPFTPEVQLRVSGFIRSDVVLQPGAIDFGAVDYGTAAEQKLQVIYAGRENFIISDARSAEPYFEVEVTEKARGGGRVAYDLLIRLTKDAPIGYVKDQLILVTNDPRGPELPVSMQGRVVPDITISPTKLFIGVVPSGQTVTKNLLVRGKKPFKILEVKCLDKSFTIKASKEAKSVHLLPVVFTAGNDPGRISQKISIRTDHGDNTVENFTAFAEVVKSDASNSTSAARQNPDDADPQTGQ
jgi:hypothetical protein